MNLFSVLALVGRTKQSLPFIFTFAVVIRYFIKKEVNIRASTLYTDESPYISHTCITHNFPHQRIVRFQLVYILAQKFLNPQSCLLQQFLVYVTVWNCVLGLGGLTNFWKELYVTDGDAISSLYGC